MSALERRRLAVYRRWLLAVVALSVYLALVVLMRYRSELHDPGFVLPNVGVLLGWGVAVSGTLMAWDRVVAARSGNGSADRDDVIQQRLAPGKGTR